uniref:EF-hand domain-containing protein n=1 Tax=Glossina austeni TaxID=7395 RepID=A0A1A9V415_GLOAU
MNSRRATSINKALVIEGEVLISCVSIYDEPSQIRDLKSSSNQQSAKKLDDFGTNDAGYDTEHTSLNSDFDETELRRELLRDKWKLLFDMFDPEGFGEITVDEFINALKSPEFITQVPMNKRELLVERAKKAKSPAGPGYVTFQDFVNVDLFVILVNIIKIENHKNALKCKNLLFQKCFGDGEIYKSSLLLFLMEIPKQQV